MRKTSRSKWSREMWVRNTEADVRGQTGWLLLWQFAPTKRTETCFKPGCLVCHWLFMGSQKAENGERMAPCYSKRQVLPVIWASPGLGQVLPVHPSSHLPTPAPTLPATRLCHRCVDDPFLKSWLFKILHGACCLQGGKHCSFFEQPCNTV